MLPWLLSFASILVFSSEAADYSSLCYDCPYKPIPATDIDFVNAAKRWYLILASTNAPTPTLPGFCGQFDITGNCKCTINDIWFFRGRLVFLSASSFNTIENRLDTHLFAKDLPCPDLAFFNFRYDGRIDGNFTKEHIGSDHFSTYYVEVFCKSTVPGEEGLRYTWVWTSTNTPTPETLDGINAALAANNITDTLTKINQDYCSYPASTYTTESTQYYTG